MSQAQWLMRSKIGPLYLVASEKGLQGIFWKKQTAPMATSLNGKTAEAKILQRTVTELEEYFAGKRQKFTVPLEVTGTPFQKKVWNALRQIPYGQTSSYKDVAGRIRHGKAMRAVGTANGCNPHAIIVPCHRVIAHDGTLGGYAGGLKIKSQLLAIEGAAV
jgi:methylated-DNA-[protein]-cysteine S-methyltransferase